MPYGFSDQQWYQVPENIKGQIAKSQGGSTSTPSTSSGGGFNFQNIQNALKSQNVPSISENIKGLTSGNYIPQAIQLIQGYMDNTNTSDQRNDLDQTGYINYQKQAAQPTMWDTFMQMQQQQQAEAQRLLEQQRAETQRQFDATKMNNLASIRQAYDKARSGYSGQTGSVEQAAQGSLNQNDINYYTQALPQLRAAMEAAGNYGGGEMLGQNVNLIAAKGQNANNINLQKTNQLQEIANAVAQLNAEQPVKEAEMQASIDAQAANANLQAIQNALAQQNTSFNQNLDLYKLGLEQSNQEWQRQYQENQAAWDRSADNPAVKARILANEAAAINLQYLPEQLQQELAQIKQAIANGRLTTEMDLETARARIKEIAANISQGQQQINNTRNNQNTNNQQQNQAAQAKAYNDAINAVDSSMYVSKDQYTGKISVNNPAGLRSYIISLNLPDADTDKLLTRYGLPIN